MTEEKKKIVITGNKVVKFVGILAGFCGIAYLTTHVFWLKAEEWNLSIIIMCFGACFACLALTRKN